MSAHVPAWKRLGLKLKGAASDDARPSSGGPNAASKPAAQVPNSLHARVNGSPASALKRKLPPSASTPNKKQRGDEQTLAGHGTPSSLKKSVSFSNDTKTVAANGEKKANKNKKKKKTKKANDTPNPDFSLEPALEYIRQWHKARDSWKFNKNHQTLLIKYLFEGDKVPSADVPTLYLYLRDLKGGVRTRLRETAAELKKKDMEAGAGAFPASLKAKARETKQKEYEETISRFMQDLQQHQQPPAQPTNANGKRPLDEVQYVLRIATPEVKSRLLKRIRAELVLAELSDSEETATTSTSASSASTGQDAAAEAAAATTRPRSDSHQPAKRRRLRDVRTNLPDEDEDDDDESGSSDSESESESDASGSGSDSSSSSSSESDDDSDEEMDMAPGGGGGGDVAGSSSSSSSSSSDGEESDDEGSSSSDED